MQPKTLIFASHNAHKLQELNEILGQNYKIISLSDLGFMDDIPEPYPTFEENALQKARTVYEKFGGNIVAEDTGLEVFALDKQPGVRSARYAGEQRSSADNIALLLEKLADKADRSAQFRTVMALIWEEQTYIFEGIVRGTIAHERRGAGGFGYDPVFIPEGHLLTFAELPPEAKHQISHRGIAATKVSEFLQNK